MIKHISFLLLTVLAINNLSAQETDTQKDQFFVNLFISADKTIYVETEKTDFHNVEKEVEEIVTNRPFKLDEEITYRIFADRNLDLGYIIDINNKMLAAYHDNVKTERYLLNTVELNIDGQNWFDSINMKELKKIH